MLVLEGLPALSPFRSDRLQSRLRLIVPEIRLTGSWHVYFVQPEPGAEPDVAAAALNEKAGWLHSLLFKLLHIHTVPTLRFVHDDQLARGIELSKLIDQANRPQHDPSVPPEPEDPDDQPR